MNTALALLAAHARDRHQNGSSICMELELTSLRSERGFATNAPLKEMTMTELNARRRLVSHFCALRRRLSAAVVLCLAGCSAQATEPEVLGSENVSGEVSLDWVCYGIWGGDGTITTQCDWHSDPYLQPPIADAWGGGYSGYGGSNPSYGNPGGGGYTGSYPVGPFTEPPPPPRLTGRPYPETVTGVREGGNDPTCNAHGICAPDRVKIRELRLATKTQDGLEISFVVRDVWLNRIPGTFDSNDNFAYSDYRFEVPWGQTVDSRPAGIQLLYLNRVHMTSNIQFVAGSWQGGMAQNGRQPIYFNAPYNTSFFGGFENVVWVPLAGGPGGEF